MDDIGTKVFRVFLAIQSHLHVLTDSPLPPFNKSGLKMVCSVDTVYGILKSENYQDYAQKTRRNCTFINSASGPVPSFLYILRSGTTTIFLYSVPSPHRLFENSSPGHIGSFYTKTDFNWNRGMTVAVV